MTTPYSNYSGAGDPRVLTRVRGEFREMPGLSPTEDQMARLFGLSLDECHGVVKTLMAEGFLHRTTDGRYRAAYSAGRSWMPSR